MVAASQQMSPAHVPCCFARTMIQEARAVPDPAFLPSHRLSGGASCDVPQHAAVRTVINSRVASERTCYRAATAKVPLGGTTIFVDDLDEDDTIEMELSPQDMRRLSQAAEEHHLSEEPVESPARSLSDAGRATLEREPPSRASSATLEIEALVQVSSGPASAASTTSLRRKPPKGVSSATLGRGAMSGAAGALLVVLAIASWSAAHRATPVEPNPPLLSRDVPATAPPTTTVPEQAAVTAATPAQATELEPVRIKNPFDRSEVFEFPPGTTPEEARQSVADLLLQRARDRHVPAATLQRRRVNGPGPGRAAKNTDLAQNTRPVAESR
jgi:hypothetical protein